VLFFFAMLSGNLAVEELLRGLCHLLVCSASNVLVGAGACWRSVSAKQTHSVSTIIRRILT
jgi:hypothetical protein